MYVNPAPHSSQLRWYVSCLQETRQTVCRMDAFILRLRAEARLQYWPKFDIVVCEEKRLLHICSPDFHISVHLPDEVQNLVFLRLRQDSLAADYLMKTESTSLTVIDELISTC